jgi:hypothetical protein
MNNNVLIPVFEEFDENNQPNLRLACENFINDTTIDGDKWDISPAHHHIFFAIFSEEDKVKLMGTFDFDDDDMRFFWVKIPINSSGVYQIQFGTGNSKSNSSGSLDNTADQILADIKDKWNQFLDQYT